MKYSINGVLLTQRFEQCRLKAYKDGGGVWTIGWGHTGNDVEEGLQITQEHADEIFIRDVRVVEDAVNELVTIELNQNEFDALVDFVFNVGINAFSESTILRLINAEDLEAASAQFDRWVYDNGNKVAGLVRRRNADEKLFETPIGDENETA